MLMKILQSICDILGLFYFIYVYFYFFSPMYIRITFSPRGPCLHPAEVNAFS